jgi:hypothetical protein
MVDAGSITARAGRRSAVDAPNTIILGVLSAPGTSTDSPSDWARVWS